MINPANEKEVITMSTNLSRRKMLLAAGGIAAASGMTALGQTPGKTPAVSGFKYRGRNMAAADIARDSSFASQEEPVYFLTDCGPDAGAMQVFRDFSELTDVHRGTILFDPLKDAQSRMRKAQASSDQITSADIELVRRQQGLLDGAQQPDAASGAGPGQVSSLISLLPRPYGGWLYEDDNFGGRNTTLSALMPDASWVGFDNMASSAKFSGLAVFSDISWYRGSKLALLYLTVTAIPALSVFQTVHGVSWNDLISCWTCVSY
jgi:hypothetical protein